MTDRRTDVLVVGAGPAGYTTAIRLGQLGIDATLVEADAHGGTCLNRGCIPSKAIISAASVAHEARTSEEIGITAEVDVDFEQFTRWKDRVVRRMGKAVEKLCKANNVDLVEGRAVFEDRHVARVLDGDGTELERVEFDYAVLATGSRPVELPGFEYDHPSVLDAADALSLSSLPNSLVVIGAGYIGMELSTAFAKLGVDVTVVEALESMLPGFPPALVEPVESRAGELGIDCHYKQLAQDWRETDAGLVLETESADGQDQFEHEAEAVLVAVGREPVTDTMNLDAIGLEPNNDGFLETDDQCRTDVPHVFAVGDVAGEPMLAHKGSAEGEVAAEVIAGRTASFADRAVPSVAFTAPELATVGQTVQEAEDAGHNPIQGEFPLRASGRALTTGHTDGFARIVASEDGRVLGGQVVGPEASELIAEIALAVEQELPVEALAETIHAHPTMAESVHEASANALGRAIHTLNR
ncbi:dihydrolipoamide dehydrogenase (plasmid) [Haloterrigena turkmenica DSM 5511]|uniref:Dihydrolipoyl dehydrogenase n=1 Tax=Haloterrigena turkmenica (strain ATCC 51198 / DSM 5511 / JCM 9101 / NCIMB 13204 / VKM B-1734 / 4k) TaxID=543526 RepID=D2S0S4_HALTV|nr:dihydrolipoyl dehydrogenase [Haloterrigena turkmenica]ADB62971.1 dihydrolipoamide dehydrogenase [Haloterrigena turkmenica DSM 5511]